MRRKEIILSFWRIRLSHRRNPIRIKRKPGVFQVKMMSQLAYKVTVFQLLVLLFVNPDKNIVLSL
jgi:hypothetical protein